MLLPRGDEYVAAVQNPRTAFGDAELRDCVPESDQFGIPKPYSGGFTATFHLTQQSREWAVRCFTRAISDLQERYAAIDHFLARNTERCFVGTFYLSKGIRIAAQWYPIIKMQWVKGETLNAFIGKNIGDAGRIKKLVPEFRGLVQRLQHLKIAHGDLQHGNIVVSDGKLVLIDYDGMFLPKLARLRTNEIGHPNYQHPGRNAAYYDASVDHFSSIVIYLGLRAISEAPKLWGKYDDSENILFRAEDFVDLARSAVLRELSALPALSSDVEKFQGVCKLPFSEVPDLETFIAGRFQHPEGAGSHAAAASAAPKAAPPPAGPKTVPPPAPARAVAVSVPPKGVPPSAGPGGQNALLDGSDVELLRRHVGQRVDVVGSVAYYHVSGKGFSRPLVLLNFGAYPDHTFTLVLRDRALKAFRSSGVDPQVLVGKRIKVSGVMASYKGKPQMEVEGPAQIQVLGGGMAAQTLVSRPAAAPVSGSHQQAGSGSPESVFDRLYGGRAVSPDAAKAAPTHTLPPRPAKAPPVHTPTPRPAKAPPARAPAPRPAKAPPARASAPRPAKTAARQAPRADRTRKKIPGVLVGIFVVVVLGVIGWAIWALVSVTGGF